MTDSSEPYHVEAYCKKPHRTNLLGILGRMKGQTESDGWLVGDHRRMVACSSGDVSQNWAGNPVSWAEIHTKAWMARGSKKLYPVGTKERSEVVGHMSRLAGIGTDPTEIRCIEVSISCCSKSA